MSDARRTALRSTLLVAVMVVGLFDAIGLLRELNARARANERAARFVRAGAIMVQAWMEETLDRGGAHADAEVAREALCRGLATEVELLDARGRTVMTLTEASPRRHELDETQRRRLREREIVVVDPERGADSRLLVYVPLRTRRGMRILRLSLDVSDLIGDARESQALVAGYVAAALLWLLAVLLVIWPARGSDDRLGQGALDAYETAVERLGKYGRRLSEQHAEQRRRWQSLVEDQKTMTRAGELTAGIVHEMRNGLGTISGHARLIARAPSDEVQQSARAVLDECAALENVIRSFLDFVRNENPAFSDFDLRRMLSRIVSRTSRAHEDVEILLECDEDAVLSGDETLIERAFENLVRNSCEAAGPRGHVWIHVAREESLLLVVVEDDGPGFARNLDGRTPLFSTTKPGGLGLGLATATKLVGLHEGRISIRERESGGARVEVRLPGPVMRAS
ncbi:MAG: HAMP domain-containing histidine kinase [Vicinamibacteria bacterium]|nr:HAMP domain-containing histidine kinase [Vicinamibacteria bacterium]